MGRVRITRQHVSHALQKQAVSHNPYYIEAQRLMSMGYFITSRKHCMVSRVDRDDWETVPTNPCIQGDADHYRRVYSKDQLYVDASILRFMHNSRWVRGRYLEKQNAPD